MKFFIMIMGAIILLLVLYYITWMIHVITPIFGKWVDPIKAIKGNMAKTDTTKKKASCPGRICISSSFRIL